MPGGVGDVGSGLAVGQHFQHFGFEPGGRSLRHRIYAGFWVDFGLAWSCEVKPVQCPDKPDHLSTAVAQSSKRL